MKVSRLPWWIRPCNTMEEKKGVGYRIILNKYRFYLILLSRNSLFWRTTVRVQKGTAAVISVSMKPSAMYPITPAVDAQ